MKRSKHSPDSLKSLKLKFNELQNIVRNDIETYNMKRIHGHYEELERVYKLINKIERRK